MTLACRETSNWTFLAVVSRPVATGLPFAFLFELAQHGMRLRRNFGGFMARSDAGNAPGSEIA